MSFDEQLYRLPLIGDAIKRQYIYFKAHTAFADLLHICLGFGLGLLVAGYFRKDKKFALWGIVFTTVGILGHIYAIINGKG